MNLGNSQKKIP